MTRSQDILTEYDGQVTYDLEDEPIVISKSILDKILKEDDPASLIALYCFYYYTGKWQKTNRVKATISYVAKGLHWNKDKVRAKKRVLRRLGLIKDVKTVNRETGLVTGWYVKIEFIWKISTVEQIIHPPLNPPTPKSTPLDARGENALSTGRGNALSAGKIGKDKLFLLAASPLEAKNSPKRQPIKITNKLESNPAPPIRYNKVGSNSEQADRYKTVADHIKVLERRSARQSIVESNSAPPEQKPEGNCPSPALIALEDKDPQPPKSVRERMNGGEPINGSVRPKAEETKIRAPRPIEDIMNHWFELGLAQIRSPRVWNSTVRTLKDLIKGKFIITNTRLNSFTTSEIKQAITNFARAALLPEYEPSNGYKDKLRTTSLINFIYNPHAPNRKSLLLYYLNNEPALVAESVPLPTPKDTRLFNTVVNVFADLSERTRESLAHIESKKLIEYADQLLPYWKKTFKRMSCFCTDPYGNFAEVLKEAWQAAYPNHTDLKSKAGSIRFFTDAWTIRHLTQYVQNITGTDGDEDDGCDFRERAEQNANQLHSAQEEALGDYAEYF